MVSVADIKKLREMTGAGMMDCKKALTENNGDIDASCDWLRKKGISQAAKKGARIASEGVIAQQSNDNVAVVLELNSETDFVAKNETFIELSSKLLNTLISAEKLDNAEDLNIPGSSNTVKDEITNAIGVIGENIKLRRFQKIHNDKGFIASYIHASTSPNLGKIGVLVSVECDNVNEESKLLAKQIAMHIAASKPVSVDQSGVPQNDIEKEKEIFTEQAKSSGKPDEIITKMVEGRIRKFYEEVVLLEQAFVIDGKTKIKDAIAKFTKDNSSNFIVKEFIRYELGEGIEKQEENFADEVNSIVANS